jgi:hypothetical protein
MVFLQLTTDHSQFDLSFSDDGSRLMQACRLKAQAQNLNLLLSIIDAGEQSQKNWGKWKASPPPIIWNYYKMHMSYLLLIVS